MKYVILSAILLAGFTILSFLISSNNVEVIKWDTSSFQTINTPHGKILNKI